MNTKQILAVLIGLALWAAYFYAMDRYIMNAQGLPVGYDLMPL